MFGSIDQVVLGPLIMRCLGGGVLGPQEHDLFEQIFGKSEIFLSHRFELGFHQDVELLICEIDADVTGTLYGCCGCGQTT